jgi:16S rRNA C967 or C1407 C5-methylase (RsmB/RsmF family)
VTAAIELPAYAYDRLERYRPLLGPEWDDFLAALRRPLPVAAWRNAPRLDAAAFEAWFREVEPGVDLEPIGWFPRAYRLWAGGSPDPRPGNRLARALGLLHLQEEVSMVPAVLLDPRPGEQVLDLCGAPGNKTALIASLMEDRGTVVCNDTDLKRLRAGRPAWERLGLSSIAATNLDGGSYPGPPGSYDRVLVDAPCSGEGTSRRVVSALRPGPPGYYRMLHGRQRQLLTRALALCKPGGRVVYSTCTYSPEEDELVVADVLERLREGATADVRLLPARLDGLSGSPGLTAWGERELPAELSKTLRIWPHQNDSGGFFVAVLEKGHEHG